jgi:hypothetical protein
VGTDVTGTAGNQDVHGIRLWVVATNWLHNTYATSKNLRGRAIRKALRFV